MNTIDVDYLVVGAGAAGMAFADTMITETDATLAIVDRYHQPGGHWTTAYPFVRLHQPSAFYGVNSRKLGSDTIDQVGWNKGLYELATAGEVCAYFDQVMQQQLLPTGRVSYFPMSDYTGSGQFQTVAGQGYQVNARRIVDATYMRAIVPSMRPAPYASTPNVVCVPPNELPTRAPDHQNYVVVGGGKTGIDACLWLLRHGFEPDRITWIIPRDSWLLDRALVQPGELFTEAVGAAVANQIAAIEAAESIDDLFDRLEQGGNLLRLDPSVRPRMYRCATVSQAELVELRRITHVIRGRHVVSIDDQEISLTQGERVPAPPNPLYVDCTADGLEKRPEVPVFHGESITLQAVRGCQQVFSAALIAHVEATYDHDSVRNELCTPVSHPNVAEDWLRITMEYNRNHLRWLADDDLMAWLESARLDQYSQLLAPMTVGLDARDDMRRQAKALLESNNEKLARLLAHVAPPG